MSYHYDMSISNNELRGYMDGLNGDPMIPNQCDFYNDGYKLGLDRKRYNEAMKLINNNVKGAF